MDMEQSMKEFSTKRVRKGDFVKGEVVQVSDEEVYVDIRQVTEGVLYKKGLTTKSIESCKDIVSVGDEIEAKVTRADFGEEPRILLSRIGIEKKEERIKFDEETRNGKIIEVDVKRLTKGGFVCEYKGIEVFMPASHVDVKRINLQEMKPKTLRCVVIENERNRIIVSRKRVLQAEYKEKRKEELDNLEAGQVVKGTVVRLKPYGAFVRLNYVDGLLHISELSHHRVEKVSDVVTVGDEIDVKILEVKNKRIKLSLKALQETPWEKFAKDHKVGEEVEAKIVRKMGRGILAEVERDVVGMIHKKDYSWNPRGNFAGEVEVGDTVKLQILSMDVKRRRMSLSKKHLEYNPWKDVSVKQNEQVSGEVTELQEKGAIVKVQNVQAFLPIGEIKSEHVKEVSDELSVGDVIKAKVIDIDPRKWKMILSVKQLKEEQHRNEFDDYLKTENKEQNQTLGDLFGDKLKDFK